jgi:hypothetical protein
VHTHDLVQPRRDSRCAHDPRFASVPITMNKPEKQGTLDAWVVAGGGTAPCVRRYRFRSPMLRLRSMPYSQRC